MPKETQKSDPLPADRNLQDTVAPEVLVTGPPVMTSLYVNGNKQTLVDWIKGQLLPERNHDYVLIAESPCGKEYTFRYFDSLPETSLPCECGSANHWIIKYSNAGEKQC